MSLGWVNSSWREERGVAFRGPRLRLPSALSSYALVAPLFAFIGVGFVVPLMFMLYLAIDNSAAARLLPNTAVALESWSGDELPGKSVFTALAHDLREAKGRGQINLLAKYANYEGDGLRDLIRRTATAVEGVDEADITATFFATSKDWGAPATWRRIDRLTQPYTLRNLLAAIDLRIGGTGAIERVPRNTTNHLGILARTIGLSALVTAICAVLALPVAFLLATATNRMRKVLLLFVLLPFWTPILVRTTGWIVLLQTEGVANSLLTQIGLISQPLPLMFNRTGVLVAMSHVLLPYMILPLFNAMASVPADIIRASASLGAPPLRTTLSVYAPLISPGLRTGCLLVFILAMGFYITPALVGGPADQMASYIIAYHTTASLNWGLASALSLALLLVLGVLLAIMIKLLGPMNLQKGLKVG